MIHLDGEQYRKLIGNDIITSSVRVLGEWLYEGKKTTYGTLSQEQRELLCLYVMSQNTDALFYSFLKEELPGKYDRILKENYFIYSAESLKQQAELTKFCDEMKCEKIRFAPIKGTDLAFRVYSHPGLRYFCDWDILFHPEDYERALQFLDRSGWKNPLPGSTDCGSLHGDPRERNHIHLEPHWNLPSFFGVKPDTVWQYMTETEPGSYRWQLSPELNMVMLCRHAEEKDFRMISLLKLLADMTMVMQHDDLDWNIIEKMSDNWKFLSPASIIRAWPEYFPAGLVESVPEHKEEMEIVRKIFTLLPHIRSSSRWDFMMSSPDRFSLAWFKAGLAGLRPVRMKSTVINAENKNQALSAAYGSEAMKGLRSLLHLFSPDPAIRDFLRANRQYSELLKKKEKIPPGDAGRDRDAEKN